MTRGIVFLDIYTAGSWFQNRRFSLKVGWVYCRTTPWLKHTSTFNALVLVLPVRDYIRSQWQCCSGCVCHWEYCAKLVFSRCTCARFGVYSYIRGFSQFGTANIRPYATFEYDTARREYPGLLFYHKKWKYTPAVRSKISSKLMFASCVWYSDRAHYELCVLMKDIGRRLPLQLQCSYQGKQDDFSQSVRGNYKKNRFWAGQNLTAVKGNVSFFQVNLVSYYIFIIVYYYRILSYLIVCYRISYSHEVPCNTSRTKVLYAMCLAQRGQLLRCGFISPIKK